MSISEKIYRHFLQNPVISTDTRKISEGGIYFALKGENFNGNRFAMEALSKGASLVVVDEKQDSGDERIIIVENVLECLQDIACLHRKELKARFIGITGSNGKTTTKELIQRVLNSGFSSRATEGNLNNHIGVPLTILSLDREVEFAVIEMGANHPGEIKRLCEIARPDFGLITNIGKAHLEGFGSFEGVVRAKSELYDFLRENDGTAFLNSDNALLNTQSAGINSYTYGTTAPAMCRGNIAEVSPFLTIAVSCQGHDPMNIRTQLPGTYNFENVMAAIAIGTYFGVDHQGILEAIANYIPSNNRSQLVKTAKGNTLILDAYNANPSSMAAAISNIEGMEGTDKVLILGDMLELGSESSREHQALVDLLRAKNFFKVFLVGDIFSSIDVPDNWKKFRMTEDLNRWLEHNPLKSCTILIKGSRKIGLEKSINSL